jgi:hypothetical protein
MLQKTYEDYHGGLMGAEEACINQALLTSLLEARKAGELDAKASELLAILKGGDDAQSS